MVMDIVIATDIAIAIPISIIMDMAMDMDKTKIKKFKTYYSVYIKKTTAMRWFFYECYFLKKIILIEIPEWTPIASLAF